MDPMLKLDRRAVLAAAAAILWALTPAAAGSTADGWVTAQNSRARLIWCGEGMRGPVDTRSQELGFIELQLEPGWKTYWRTPGDSGVAPAFDWADASNIAKTTAYYPAPHRIADQGGEAIGYHTSVIFPVHILRRDPNSATHAAVTASFGICKNICIPVEVKLDGACYDQGMSPAIAMAVEVVPRAPGQARDSDPKLMAVGGSVAGTSPRLTVDVDFGTKATDTDLFIEAPEGLYVPLPRRAVPDAKGRARFTVDLSNAIDAKDLIGKELRLTMVSSKGASEALWVAK